jgi:hypothetical protein
VVSWRVASTETHFYPVPAEGAYLSTASQWQSRQIVVTPELLGMRSTGECQQRAERLGLTPLPWLPRRQEYWRLDVLLVWAHANGLDRLPWLGLGAR